MLDRSMLGGRRARGGWVTDSSTQADIGMVGTGGTQTYPPFAHGEVLNSRGKHTSRTYSRRSVGWVGGGEQGLVICTPPFQGFKHGAVHGDTRPPVMPVTGLGNNAWQSYRSNCRTP